VNNLVILLIKDRLGVIGLLIKSKLARFGADPERWWA
jgi:hypothetical protein